MSYIDTQNLLPQMKTYLPWLAEADSQALKYSCRQLDNAYKGFFKGGKGFPTFESAMEEAHKQFKEEAKTYRKSYGADNITTEEYYRDLYIKGHDFTDWWTVVEVPTAEEED